MATKPELKIDWATYEAAKYACEHWHYSKKMPIGRTVRLGVWENGVFIGCIIYSRGSSGVGSIYKTYKLKKENVIELARVALRNHVTPVSRIIAITLKKIKKAQNKIRLIVSYADQQQSHLGIIYQAMNWIYIGESSKDFVYIDANDKIWHSRSVSNSGIKIIYGERVRCPIISTMTKKEIPRKYKYLYPLDDAMRKQILPLSKPYPKRVQSIDSDAPAIHQVEGGASPTCTLHNNKIKEQINNEKS